MPALSELHPDVETEFQAVVDAGYARDFTEVWRQVRPLFLQLEREVVVPHELIRAYLHIIARYLPESRIASLDRIVGYQA